MPLSFDEIADAITASIEEFDRAFLQTQVEEILNPAKRVGVYGIGGGSDRRELIARAVAYAGKQRWLDKLLVRLVDAGLEDGRLTQNSFAATQGAQLQAITDLAAGFAHPELFYKRLGAAMGWTVLVLLDNQAVGSGVLVGPHRVLTAWHVVQELFEWRDEQWHANELLQTCEGQAPRLQVEFDNRMMEDDGAIMPRRSFRIAAAREWCVAWSPAHDEELGGRLPGDLGVLDGFWDYAVIELQTSPGMERRWAEMSELHVVPAARSPVSLLQHPGGKPLRLANHLVADTGKDFAHAVPSLRFVHLANSLPGSSGGPCFDKQFALFGIHQGVWPHTCTDPRFSISNRGIPLMQIVRHMAQKFDERPSAWAKARPIFSLDSTKFYAPVIGCNGFVALLWRIAEPNVKSTILIDGEPKTGKTFRTEVLVACLPDAMHLKIVLDATMLAKERADQR